MSRSLLRLVGTSVLLCLVVGIGVLFTFSKTRTWTDAAVKRQGVRWAYRTLDAASAAERKELLEAMAGHFVTEVSIVPIADVADIAGESPKVGQNYFDRNEPRAQFVYIPFHDQTAALVAGPFDPVKPEGFPPIGIFLAILFTPLVASMVTVRLARQLKKVERATEAIGVGELSARVDNPTGPSHELAASFNTMAEKIERLVKDRDELVQAVSHELGSPLSRLQFQLELLANASDEAGRRARTDAMAREIEELHELVAELSSWVQADAAALRRDAFDATKPLRDLAALAQLHTDRDVTVSAALPDGAVVYADPRLFQRAIENLLRNAVHYGMCSASVALTQGEDGVRVVVEDDGPGIPAADRARVLKPFVRIDPDRDRDTGGVGLGLAIVSRIVHHHGGAITIDESPLGGARVTTLWPARAAETAS